MPVLQPAARPGGPHLPTPERVPALNTRPAAEPGDRAAAVELLRRGELTVRGRLTEASNAVLLCRVAWEGRAAACVYKPVSGERPLWDFPDGTLAGRELAAYLVSEATGWHLVPPTVLREEGPLGPGMCQLWIDTPDTPLPDDDQDEKDDHDATDDQAEAGDGADAGEPEQGERPRLLALLDPDHGEPGWLPIAEAEVGEGRTALLAHADLPALRRLAVVDAVINNGDRKGRHLLATTSGRIYGIDHGVSFHTDGKLRTLLWGWAGEPLPAEAVGMLDHLAEQLRPGGGPLDGELRTLLTEAERDALRARVARMRATGRHPEPSNDWPAVPWPPI